MTDQRSDEMTTSDAEESLAATTGAAQTPAAAGSEDAGSTTPGGAADAAQVVTEGHAADERDEEQGAAAADAGLTAGEADADCAVAGSDGSGRRAQLEREGEIAADFIETLLDICDLDGDLDVDIDGDRAAVALVDSDEGRVPRRLVGSDGEVLDALQELTRLAVKSETGERSRLMLDVAGHRAGRRSELVRVAQEAVAGVKESGEAASLEPMTAFERKVVHDEVLAAGLHSESEGTEPNRYVVVRPQ